MDAALNIKNKFPLEDQPLVGYLGQFTLSLVQAFLKTGYYKPGHQGAQIALDRLYQEWLNLAQNQRDLSFMIDDSEDKMGVRVYGFLSEIIPVKKLFSPDMAELFVPKFRDYFDRRHLISFTIKPEISFDEFGPFVDIMSAPPENLDLQQSVTAMTENLVHRQIVHISVIYAEELISKDALHWMTRIVLSRLNKDLCVLPLYTHLTADQRLDIKRKIFRELLRPLKDTAVIKEILIYSDQRAHLCMDEDMEAELICALRPEQHLSVVLECARELESLVPDKDSDAIEPDQARYQRLLFVLRKMIPDLSLDAVQDEQAISPQLETLIQSKILLFEALPESWQKTLTRERKVNDYLKNPEGVLKRLKAEWTESVHEPIQILSLLLDRNLFQPFVDLFEGLAKDCEARFGSLNNTFYAEVDVGMVGLGILTKLQDRRFPHRKELLEMVARTKHPSPKALIPFCAHEDIWLRRNICRVLAGFGDLLIPDLIQWAKDPACHWQGVRNGVMILGDIGQSNDEVLRFLDRCRSHPRQRVREEVIASHGKIKGEISLKQLLAELTPKEPEKGLISPAVLALGNFQPVPTPFLTFLKEAVRKKRKDEKETDEKIAVNSCLAISAIAAFDFETAQSFEPILVHALIPEKTSLFHPTGKHHEKEYAVRKAICTLLGVIGTKETLPLLTKLLKEKPWLPEDKERIKQAIGHIQQRLEQGHGRTGPRVNP